MTVFIACFRIKGNVGFFIALIDFIRNLGTVTLLSTKEFLNIELEWFALFNHIAGFVGATCSILFIVASILIHRKYMQGLKLKNTDFYINPQYNTI